jgi:hypothetical protein
MDMIYEQLGISSYANLFNDDVYLDYKFEIIHTTISLVSCCVYNP